MRTATLLLAAVALAGATSVLAGPPIPHFPPSYSVQETVVAVQTGQPNQYGQFMSYWSQGSALNATALRAPAQSTVYMYDTQKVYFIQGTVCSYYCDMQGDLQCNLEDSLCAYDLRTKAKYTGQAMRAGQLTNEYQWVESLGPIPMNYLSLFVDPSAPVPVFQNRTITPFGKYIGYMNTTYSSFKVGAPPASAFDIPNEKYCQLGSDAQCQNAVKGALPLDWLLQ